MGDDMFISKGEKIGSGSFGSVYLDTINPKIAIKQYKPNGDGGIKPEVLREICLLSKLDHPCIIKMLSIRYGYMYEIAMDYGGINLRRYSMLNDWNHRVNKLIWITKEILSGLIYLHDSCIIHRDLKPDNILILDDRVRICDFGIAKRIAPDSSNHTLGDVGTFNYRAPEIFVNSIGYGQEVDIWSLGCLLYEFLMKTHLFKGSTDIIRLTKIFEIVPTSEHDLKLLGLDIIDLQKCNTSGHFKIPPFYGPGSSLSVRKLLDSYKRFIQQMIVLDPKKRISARNALHMISNEPITTHTFTPERITRNNVLLNDSIIRDMEVVWILDQNCKMNMSERTCCLAVELLDLCLSNTFNIPKMSRKRIYKNLHIISCVCLVLASKYIDVKHVRYNKFSFIPVDILEWETQVLNIVKFNLEIHTVWDDLEDKSIQKIQQMYLEHV